MDDGWVDRWIMDGWIDGWMGESKRKGRKEEVLLWKWISLKTIG